MRINNDVKTISASLSFMGLGEMAERMETDIKETIHCQNTTSLIASSFSVYAGEIKTTRSMKCLKASKLPEEVLFSDYVNVRDRNISPTLIDELRSLYFLEEHRPLVIEGNAGVGKTWLGMAVAKKACDECYRVRWTVFGELLCELRALKKKDEKEGTAKYLKKVRHYTNFDLLCIDEFLNSIIHDSDIFILQEIFDMLYRRKKSFLICTQCDVKMLPEMLSNKSIAEALRGRILERAKVITITGPDIRFQKTEVRKED